ncbi:uncharacterized protein LOC129717304 [Wyeomyia smithii]|uniref:uncharacterized protein LOC129717304 n=1 Tax=Wyeomyia smithii TaxID=174621 RepID=UPI002467F40C|nr:uncharacterized protein LOC129717304 [Wyeomyia smithii]
MDLIHCPKCAPEEDAKSWCYTGRGSCPCREIPQRVEEDIDAIDEIVMAANNDVLNKFAGVTYAKQAMNILTRTFQKVGGQPDSSSVALVNQSARKDVQCFGCQEYGHYRSRCPKNKKEKKKNKRTAGHTMMAGERAEPPKKEKNVRFIVDSGATERMVRDEALLEDVRVLEKPITITTAKSGQELRATKSRKIRLKSVIGLNKITPVVLYNILFIPGLESYLLLVRKCNEMGKKVIFVDDSVSILSFGEVIAKGKVVDGLYCLDFTLDLNQNQSDFDGKVRAMLHESGMPKEMWG